VPRPSTPLRQHVGRALRLVAVTGTGLAGLCLVIGAVTLVATVTGSAHATGLTAAAHQSVSRGGDYVRARGHQITRGGADANQILAVFTGHGSQDTPLFAVGGAGTWTLRWSYRCQASRRPGSFIVSERATDAVSRASVHELGPVGHGATWTYRDAGTHYLAIRSGCAWTTKVVGRP
jgi:hypothetical protein